MPKDQKLLAPEVAPGSDWRMQSSTADDAPHRRQPSSRLSEGVWTRLGRTGIILFVLTLWQVGSAAQWWSSATIPSPRAVVDAGRQVLGTDVFREALRVTLQEVGLSFFGGIVLGGLLGILFWKVPYLGRISEPFLVSFYAVPFMVFYPVMLVLIGLNSWPIIILATLMATIPMALNTWIGLVTVRPVYWALAASLECTRSETLFRIALPAAAPIIFAGVRLAAIYSLIASVAMEFLLAPNGLGFQIRYRYELFEQPTMFVYVIVVFLIASGFSFLVLACEERIVGRTSRA